MTILYSALATIYHEMYQHVFDYDKEFDFYDRLLKSNSCNKILEVGCGTGMLARRFIRNGYDYLGLDLSEEMLEIARTEVGQNVFIRSDMRSISIENQFDCVLITGRSLAYVIENRGIMDTFAGVHRSLKNNGLFVFGVFEANTLFNNFNDFEQIVEHDGKKIKRISKLRRNLETGWTYDWQAKYLIEKDGQISEFEDLTTLRAFTKEEILLFLKLSDFKVRELIEEDKVFTLITEKI
jgi:SAM-dependent methyltransferase